MNLYELDNNEFVLANSISKNEFDSLLNRLEISKYFHSIKIPKEHYINNKGEIFLKLEDGVVVFDNINDYDAVINKGYFTKLISHTIMYGKNPLGKSFSYHTQELVKELLTELNIKIDSGLIIDENIIKEVQLRISEKAKPFHFYRKYFANILSLLGSFFINKFEGMKWLLEQDNDRITWNPFLIYQSHKIALFKDLNDELFKAHNKCNPLTSVIDSY